MNNATSITNNIWQTFTFAAFGLAACMMAGGIFFLEASFSAKGFYAMAAIMLVYTSVAMTKTLRDNEETKALHNRIESARTEKLLMDTKDSDLI
ncbi:YiaA/YiaB family inner membrane protein [Pseudahrensia aquimaris]|uniref:YiaA/YiaB family inner membrane protein n=1 Tax=Pseudahrensia aquimaris TaxID=744461 RepID=A0ABW3FD72_9HYPH